MNKKHQRTLDLIFETPTRSNIRFDDIISLMKALGAEVTTGKGSRVRIVLNGAKATFHRAHPGSETDKGTVESFRKFLIIAGSNEA